MLQSGNKGEKYSKFAIIGSKMGQKKGEIWFIKHKNALPRFLPRFFSTGFSEFYREESAWLVRLRVFGSQYLIAKIFRPKSLWDFQTQYLIIVKSELNTYIYPTREKIRY